jgi:Flp pilus assembly protein TadG
MMRRPQLRKDERGNALIEFALIAPVFIGFIIAISQLGLLFFANAGLANAVGEGARLATIFPRPTDAQIIARIANGRYGLDPARITGPTIQNVTQDGISSSTITISYAAPVDFIFYKFGPITLTQTRRVYTHQVS